MSDLSGEIRGGGGGGGGGGGVRGGGILIDICQL